MRTVFIVSETERGLLVKDGRLMRVLEPGRHVIWDVRGAYSLVLCDMQESEAKTPWAEVIEKRHPAIAEAAVVGLAHPKWQERPFVLIVPRRGQEVTLEQVRDHLSSAFASWQLPDAIEIVSEIPRTSVGKFDKKRIRAAYAGTYEGDHGNA